MGKGHSVKRNEFIEDDTAIQSRSPLTVLSFLQMFASTFVKKFEQPKAPTGHRFALQTRLHFNLLSDNDPVFTLPVKSTKRKLTFWASFLVGSPWA
jgi:hypothetical protein